MSTSSTRTKAFSNATLCVSGATRTGSSASLADWVSEKARAAITVIVAARTIDFQFITRLSFLGVDGLVYSFYTALHTAELNLTFCVRRAGSSVRSRLILCAPASYCGKSGARCSQPGPPSVCTFLTRVHRVRVGAIVSRGVGGAEARCSMAFAGRAFSGVRVAGFLLGAGILAAVGLIYASYISQQRQYIVGRDFRLLSNLAKQVPQRRRCRGARHHEPRRRCSRKCELVCGQPQRLMG